MWPDSVERVARFLRAAGVQGRLEELPEGVDEAPGEFVVAIGFECDGRPLVALVANDRAVDRDRLARIAGCRGLRPAAAPGFPYQRARVFLDRAVFAETIVWVKAGSARHVLGLSPADLRRLTRSQTADLVAPET